MTVDIRRLLEASLGFKDRRPGRTVNSTHLLRQHDSRGRKGSSPDPGHDETVPKSTDVGDPLGHHDLILVEYVRVV